MPRYQPMWAVILVDVDATPGLPPFYGKGVLLAMYSRQGPAIGHASTILEGRALATNCFDCGSVGDAVSFYTEDARVDTWTGYHEFQPGLLYCWPIGRLTEEVIVQQIEATGYSYEDVEKMLSARIGGTRHNCGGWSAADACVFRSDKVADDKSQHQSR